MAADTDRETLVRAFGDTAAARYLDSSEELVRERYSSIDAGEGNDVARDAPGDGRRGGRGGDGER